MLDLDTVFFRESDPVFLDGLIRTQQRVCFFLKGRIRIRNPSQNTLSKTGNFEEEKKI